jgi:Peptidase family M23
VSTEPYQPADPTITLLQAESRPSRLLAARYDQLPFPNIGPTQEVAFDLGLTAHNRAILLTGVVFAGYNDHQLLFEQRWPARIIQKRLGEADLTIPANTGLALRSLHFLLHGYEQLTHVEVTVVGKTVDQAGGAGQRIETMLQIPVVYPEQRTDLHFPLRGAWWAIQAADWSDQHKQEVFSQVYAIDFVKLGADNNFFGGSGSQLTDHYSWDQPVYATAGGKVAFVCYDMPDLLPGTPPNPLMFRDDPRRILGNAVAISHGNGEFSYFAHLQQASLVVREGELIRRGALLGHVGNSGSSPGPHLHFQLMDGPNLFIDQGLPLKFSHFSAGGQFFEQPTTIPTRMIVFGPEPGSATHEQ